ncbi:hypothetical protein CsSME_00002212 [Camellia sinensis var. sinensis]
MVDDVSHDSSSPKVPPPLSPPVEVEEPARVRRALQLTSRPSSLQDSSLSHYH